MGNDIDFVITWVDGNDTEWFKEKCMYSGESGDNSDARFRDWGLLKYWFRAVEKYAPWVRRIHFVTWGHVPDWLDINNPKLHVVKHEDFIPREYLPTFNSHTIELNLHRIPDLAEQFVYFNDDVFLNKHVTPEIFFKNGFPCDCFSLEVPNFSSKTIGSIVGSNTAVINDNFKLKESVRKNWKKYFHPRNGIKKVIKNGIMISCCKEFFPAFHHWHLSFSFLKSSFYEVWAASGDVLDDTCSCRFREKTNVSPGVIKNWQLANGKFYPSSVKLGHCYHLTDSRVRATIDDLINSTHSIICINDADRLSNMNTSAEEIRQAFDLKLSCRSSFEL